MAVSQLRVIPGGWGPGVGEGGEARTGACCLLIQVAVEVLITLVAESHLFPLPFPGLSLSCFSKGYPQRR